MNKIAKSFIAGIIAVAFIMPSVSIVKAQQVAEIAPTQIEMQEQYQSLLRQLITLLTAKLAELQAKLVELQNIEAQNQVEPSVNPIVEPVVEPVITQNIAMAQEEAFTIDVEINGQKTNSIKRLASDHEMWVKYKVMSKTGNTFSVRASGFYENTGGAIVSFMQAFPEKKLYEMTITAIDTVTGAQSSLVVSVDTR